MGGPNPTTKTALESRWVLDGGVALGEAGKDNVGPGVEIEFRRRIVFHPHELKLGQLNTNNHWSLDLGLGAGAAGWAGKRPATLMGVGRFGINYNLLNIVGIGPTFRAGYASTSDGTNKDGGLLWSAALRFGGVINHLSVSSEVGILSLPSPTGDGSERSAYGMALMGYLF
ncbi:MAG TPA: hypothetical protein VFX30_00205 [bacterium]|nr:hypothetical protein [bacterium]